MRILHKGPSGMTETPVQLKKILRTKAPDMQLRPDDILVVPSSSGKLMVGAGLAAALQAQRRSAWPQCRNFIHTYEKAGTFIPAFFFPPHGRRIVYGAEV